MTESEYLRRYSILSTVHDLGFKPEKIAHREGRKIIGYSYSFSPTQKSRITKLSSAIDDEGMRKNSHLYNVARAVKEGTATLVKVRKSKYRAEKMKSMADANLFTTSKGVIVFEPTIEKVKIKRRGKKGYSVEYTVRPTPPKDKRIKQVATFERREIFIPIPLFIWQDEDLLAIFLADLQRQYKPLNFRLAINGRQGKTAFESHKIYHYITTSLAGNFVTDKPYVTGVYLIYKKKVKTL